MNKGGLGVGSASIILVFAVLSLTIFSLITFVVSENDRALVEAQSNMVVAYYRADSAAERIVAEILDMDSIPETVQNINIVTHWDYERQAESARFLYPINDISALYIHLVLREETFDILSWRMYSIDDWIVDDSLPVWQGDGFDFLN